MRPITALIDPQAISKAGRFFDASDRQIVSEMLQNARRAGASRVDIRITDTQVTMTDDGLGITDPQTLLSFGTSGWSSNVRNREDAAGMGFFSLASRKVTVESHPADGPAWRIDLEPAHFTGDKAAEVHPGAGAPAPRATRVTFSRRQDELDIADQIAGAARHCPLKVSVNGKAVEHEDFLEHAVHVSEYDGVRIGVFHGAEQRNTRSRTYPRVGSINLHGHVVACPELPSVFPVSERGGRIAKPWSTAVDIADCPQLELVLPGRHKAVDNDFLHRLAQACRRAIYHAILEHGEDTRLKRADQIEALIDEIPVPVPPSELEPWGPPNREDDCAGYKWTSPGTRFVYRSDDTKPLVMDALPEYATGQIAARALDQAGMLENVFKPVAGYNGYNWYDELDRITGITVAATTGGETETLMDDEHDPPGGYLGATTRVDKIAVTLQIANRCSSARREVVLQTDASFANADPEHHDEIGIVLTRKTTITASELAVMMVKAFFAPSLEGGDDSIETQRQYHETEYARIATEATASVADARKQYLEQLAENNLAFRLRAGESITVARYAKNRTAIRITLAPEHSDTPERADIRAAEAHRKDTDA